MQYYSLYRISSTLSTPSLRQPNFSSSKSITQHILYLTLSSHSGSQICSGFLKISVLLLPRLLGSALLLVKPLGLGLYLPVQQHQERLRHQGPKKESVAASRYEISSKDDELDSLEDNSFDLFKLLKSISLSTLLQNFCTSALPSLPIFFFRYALVKSLECLVPSLSNSPVFSLLNSIVDQLLLTRPELIYTSHSIFGMKPGKDLSSKNQSSSEESKQEQSLTAQVLELLSEISPWLKMAFGRILLQSLRSGIPKLMRGSSNSILSKDSTGNFMGVIVTSTLIYLVSEAGLSTLDLVAARWRIQLVQEALGRKVSSQELKRDADHDDELERVEGQSEEASSRSRQEALRGEELQTSSTLFSSSSSRSLQEASPTVLKESLDTQAASWEGRNDFFYLMLGTMKSEVAIAEGNALAEETSTLSSRRALSEDTILFQTALLASLSNESSLDKIVHAERQNEHPQEWLSTKASSVSSGKDGSIGGDVGEHPLDSSLCQQPQSGRRDKVRELDLEDVSAPEESNGAHSERKVASEEDSSLSETAFKNVQAKEKDDNHPTTATNVPEQLLISHGRSSKENHQNRIPIRPSKLSSYPYSIRTTVKTMVEEEGFNPFFRAVGLGIGLSLIGRLEI